MKPEGPDWKKRLKDLGLSRVRRPRAEAPARTRSSTREVGLKGEDLAARFLAGQGLELLARNVRYTDGELDIVGSARGTLVVVEVKWRRGAERGSGPEAVTSRKRRRIVLATRHWLFENQGRRERAVRFDVVAIQERPFEIEWIRGAFDASI